MAIFHITPTTSRFNAAGSAFGPPADDTPGADTLIVDPGAFLIASNGNGANLAPTGAWTVTVNRSIVSQSEGDVNGDKNPDFSIQIADPTHAITLTSASFTL